MGADDAFDPCEVDRLASEYVKAGFWDRDDVIQMLMDVLEEELESGKLRPLAVQATEDAIKDQRVIEAAWPPLTDCDRLDLAFENLEDSGIVARQNFTCCQNCGHAEIAEEIEDARERGVKVRGYAFYHQQDTESAVEGAGLHIAYGALADGEEEALKIAREIVAAMEKCELKTRWNGTVGQRIGVTLEWRRRFPHG